MKEAIENAYAAAELAGVYRHKAGLDSDLTDEIYLDIQGFCAPAKLEEIEDIGIVNIISSLRERAQSVGKVLS